MSARAVAWAWEILPDLSTPSEKLVLLRFADRADPEGRCWPGIEKTAQDLGVTETSVRTSVRGLINLGLISLTPRKVGGRNTSHLYQLLIEQKFNPSNFNPSNSEERGLKRTERQKFNPSNFVPESFKEKANLPKERARGGGGTYEIDKNGINHDPKSQRDQQAMFRISEYRVDLIKTAVIEAAGLDDAGRAFPSAVLKILLRNAKTNAKPAAREYGGSAWSRGAFTNIHRNDLNNGGDDGLIIDV